MWLWERSSGTKSQPFFNLRCSSGKVRLPLPQEPPAPLLELLTWSSPTAREFREKIRAYNNVLAFSSIGLRVDESVANAIGGAYCLRILGRVYHRICPILPAQGQQPAFAQIYIHDPAAQIRDRRSYFEDLDPFVLEGLQQMLLEVNPFAATLQSVFERLRNNPDVDLSIRISGDVSREDHQYAAPSAAEVAVIIPGDLDSEQATAHRDVMYITKEGESHYINETHLFYDPLHYVLLFPRGELGWHPRLQLYNANAGAQESPESEDEGESDEGDDEDGQSTRSSRSRVTHASVLCVHAANTRKRPYP